MPWDVAQDAMTAEAVVILAGVAQVVAVHAQDEIRNQVLVLAQEFARVGGGWPRKTRRRRSPGRCRLTAWKWISTSSSSGTATCGFTTGSSAGG